MHVSASLPNPKIVSRPPENPHPVSSARPEPTCIASVRSPCPRAAVALSPAPASTVRLPEDRPQAGSALSQDRHSHLALQAAPPWRTLMGTRPCAPDEKWCLIAVDTVHRGILMPSQLSSFCDIVARIVATRAAVPEAMKRVSLVFVAGPAHMAHPLGDFRSLLLADRCRDYTGALLSTYLRSQQRTETPRAAQSHVVVLAATAFAVGRVVPPSAACAEALLNTVPPSVREWALTTTALYLARQGDDEGLIFCVAQGAEPFWPLWSTAFNQSGDSIFDALCARGRASLLAPFVNRLSAPADLSVLWSLEGQAEVQADAPFRRAVAAQIAKLIDPSQPRGESHGKLQGRLEPLVPQDP